MDVVFAFSLTPKPVFAIFNSQKGELLSPQLNSPIDKLDSCYNDLELRHDSTLLVNTSLILHEENCMEKQKLISRRLPFLLQIFVLIAVIVPGIARAAGQQLSAAAMQNFAAQVQQLKAEKQAMTPVQLKINSNIVRHLHIKVLKDKADNLPQLQTGIDLNNNDEVLVDIKANVTDSLLALIQANGGTIINQFPQYRAIRALIPITAVESIAADTDVQFIDLAAKAETRKLTTSEGDAAHRAPAVRGQGYAGAGIKVGVLSDSVDNLATVQASGDLPAVNVLQDAPGNSGEGTAMLEIVYDLAPAASLYFATA